MCGVRSPAQDVRRAVWAAPSQRGAQTALRVSSLVTNALSKGEEEGLRVLSGWKPAASAVLAAFWRM